MTPDSSASGRLSEAPLASLLARFLEQQAGGTLELANSDTASQHMADSATLVLHRGKLLKIRSNPTVCYLGTVAYELGYIDAAELDASLMQLAKAKTPHGQILVSRRSITREQLGNALREQALRKLTHLFTFAPDTSFVFRGDVDLLPGYGGVDPVLVDPLPAIWRGIRDYSEKAQVSSWVQRLADTPLRIANRVTADRFAFQPDEYTLVECLSIKPMTFADLCALDIVPAQTVGLLLFCLATTNQLQRAAEAPKAMTAPPRPVQPSAVTRGSQTTIAPLVARGAAIAERAIAIASEDHFRRLGISRTANREQIDAAFAKLAQTWDPAQLPADLANETRHDAGRVYLALSEAHRVLADGAQRELYLRKLTGAYDPTADLAASGAKTAIEGARTCVRRNDAERAVRLARFALEAEPQNPIALALLAWVEALRPGNETVEAALASIAQLDRAVNLNVICEDALYYRSLLHSRVGNHRMAVRDLQRVVEINPQNVDAVRALRVYHMRLRSGSVSMKAVDPHPSNPSGIVARAGALASRLAGAKR